MSGKAMADRPRTVLVTGASSGIGRATALLLAQRGFTVLAGVRKLSDGDALHAEGGPRLRPILVDVADARSVAAAADEVRVLSDELGLDGLVNNAGIGLSGPMEYVPLDEVHRLFQVNAFGPLAVTQAVLPMLRQARGRIVNIGSIGAHVAIPFGGVLNATKSALSAFNDALRLELRPFGIHVVLVEPAAVATPAVDKMLGDPEGTIRALPEGGAERYGMMLRAFTRRAYDREMRGSKPEVVARVVLDAMTAKTPRAKYLVGKDAHSLAALPRLLPARVFDRVALGLLGMPTKFGAMTT
jgi:NAD(P)-dependent dehydrogenase (short-subunit alcohol dehydrogenase family)